MFKLWRREPTAEPAILGVRSRCSIGQTWIAEHYFFLSHPPEDISMVHSNALEHPSRPKILKN